MASRSGRESARPAQRAFRWRKSCQDEGHRETGWRPGDLLAGSRHFSRLVASRSPGAAELGQGGSPSSLRAFRRAGARRRDQVGAVEQPVAVTMVFGMIVSGPDGRMSLVTVTDPAFAGCAGDSAERLGGAPPGGQHPGVVDRDQVAAADPDAEPLPRSRCHPAAGSHPGLRPREPARPARRHRPGRNEAPGSAAGVTGTPPRRRCGDVTRRERVPGPAWLGSAARRLLTDGAPAPAGDG